MNTVKQASKLCCGLTVLLVAGSLVLGYLPGYLSEEGFSSGSDRYALLGLLLPRGFRQPVALVLLAGLAVAALWQARQHRPELPAVWLYGGSLLISTPEYPWYCLPLLALAALANRLEWFAVALATQWSSDGAVKLSAFAVPVQ